MDASQFIDVLLVEDSPSDALLVQEALRESALFRLSHVQRLGEALEVISQKKTSVVLVLLDLGLPDSQGLDTLDTLHRHAPDLPVIVLTTNDDEELAVHTAKAGADEYLVKNQLQDGNLRRTIRHVIERNSAARGQRESEQRLRTIIDTTPQCIKVVSQDGRIREMNAAGLAMIEATMPEAVIGHCFLPLIAPECQDDFRAFHEAVCRGHRGNLDFEIIGLRGTRRKLEMIGAPLLNPDGSTSHLAISQDVTERRKAQADLLLRDRAIQAVSQGITITDAGLPDNPIIYASIGFERMTGYTSQEVVGKNCRFLQGPDTDPNAVTRVREAIQEKRACTIEILNYRKDGTAFWNVMSVFPIFEKDSTVKHFVGIQTDVTERRGLENLLRQSQKMEAVGQLAGGVAHDFNNLLTVILGCCESLQDDADLTVDGRELTALIQNSGKRAAALTGQLLAFSRQQVLKPTMVNLNDVVSKSAKLLVRLIGEDICLKTILFSRLWSVKVDIGQIEQVLMNLAVNARDAMPLGGHLTIETANVELDDHFAGIDRDIRPGEYVMIAVSDDGSGMDPQIKAHVFEPFFTTKEQGKGTGLGLPMVFGIVKQSGGFIALYSEAGHGTTFKVYFPKVGEFTNLAIDDKPHPAPAGGTETLLVVEDEATVRHLAARTLRSHGYTVLEASNGKEALLVCERHERPIHFVLTDVIMPEMNGRELSEKLRILRPDLKVLFMSGYTNDAVVRHGVSDSKHHFLQKPFTVSALIGTVRQVLDGRIEA